MLFNHLKIALRTLLKFKEYALINLVGLGLGLASGIFILVYVLDETSFDKFHAKADRIYRVGTDVADIKTGAINGTLETNGWPVGALLKEEYPEVEAMVYIRNGSNLSLIHEGKREEERIYYAGPEFFNLFSFPLKAGDRATALTQPNSVVITETVERKYFGDKSALGKTMIFADTLSFVVAGVLRDLPAQSHMQFDILISFDTYKIINPNFSFNDGWGNINVRNYVLLRKGVDKDAFFAKARNLYMNHVEQDMKKFGMLMYVGFEPLDEIYLQTKRGNGMGPSGSLQRVYIVSGIAVFVVLLACINFINLTTARSVYRAKEVGLRKVVGSSRAGLVRQFLSESFLVTFISFIFAIVLIGLLLPLFNQLMAKDYNLSALSHPSVIAGILSLLVFITFLSGYYPAIVLSGLKPAQVLKGKIQNNVRGVQLRRALVVFQFTISAILIVFTLVVNDQLNFMKNQDLGFSGNQILVLNVSRLPTPEFVKPANFKNDLKKIASVEGVTFCNALPGKPGWVGQWAHAEQKSADETVSVEYMTIDEDFIATLGLKMIAGRNFDLSRPGELEDGLIVNEKTVDAMGFESPEKALGKKITSPSQRPAGTIIGVVKNYNEFGLQKEIYPMTMDYAPNYSRYFAVKFNASNTEDILAQTKKLWAQYYEGYNFEYFFLDENFERQYQAEQRLSMVFNIFSAGSVIIAVIGLFGLVSFMVVTRTKEIGIRKVLGASVSSITGLLSKEFVWLVLIANFISFPIAWYFASHWLEGFAYHTSLSTSTFTMTLMTSLVITLITVGIQTIKSAMTDPVESLRYE